jgi:hypothetical protein
MTNPEAPRLTLVVAHNGMVRVSSCHGCTDTVDEVVEVLERVTEVIKSGTDPVVDYRLN